MKISLLRDRRYSTASNLLLLIGIVVISFFLIVGYFTLNSRANAASVVSLETPHDGAVVKGSKYRMSWTRVADAKEYQYESFYDAAAKKVRWQSTYPDPINFKDSYNIPEQTYWWRVRAVDASGAAGEWSALRKLTVDNTNPIATVSSAGDGVLPNFYRNNVVITGKADPQKANIVSYEFSVTRPDSSVYTTGKIPGSSLTHVYHLNTPTMDGEYKVRYTVFDQAGKSSLPAETSFTLDTVAPANAPALSGVVERYMKPGLIIRTWDGSAYESDIYGYAYKSFKSYDDARNNTETADYNFIHTTFANGSDNYELGGQTGARERTFYYRVAAIDKAGNKTWSNEIHSVTVDGTPPPAPSLQVTDLTNGALTNKTATATTWNKPSEDTLKYNLRYYTNIPGSSNTQATPLVTELAAEQWSGVLGEGTGQYTFQVQAIDRADNESSWSDPFVINLDVAAPDAPALTVSNEKGTIATNAVTKYSALTAEWNKPSDDTAKYTYQYWNDIAASPWKESTPNTFESTTQTWSGDLEGGSGTYYLRVQATDAAGNTSPWSDTFVINLDTIPPAVTVNPITSIETPNSAAITAAIQDLTITKATIVITGATSGVVANTEVTVTNGTVTYEFVTPAVDTYTVTVIAKDAADNETTSLAQTFAVKAPVVIVPEEKPAVPVTSGSGNNTPANPAPTPADDDPIPAGNAVAQNTAPDAEGEVFDDTDAAQNPQPRANTFGVDGGGTNDAQEIQGISDTKAFDWGFGVPWWGWLFGIATIAGGWWIIAGIRRRRQQDE